MEGEGSVGVYKHIVLVKFKDEVSEEKIKEIIKRGGKLPSLIPEIKSHTWGLDESTRAKTQGFTHVFEFTFDKMEHIEIYYDHPDHVEFSKFVTPFMEKIIAVNYKSTSPTEF